MAAEIEAGMDDPIAAGFAAIEVTLPSPLVDTLEQLCQDMGAQLGKELAAVILHGSAARDDWRETRSDVNLMIVVHEVTPLRLEQIDEHLFQAQHAWPIQAEVITHLELERSADVFPLKFLEMQRAHVLLHGQDVLAALDIRWDHLRLRVEQRVKEALFTLRARYARGKRRPERLLATLDSELAAFLSCIGAILFLKDGSWWISGKDAVIQAAAEELDLDADVLTRLLAIQRRERAPDAEQLLTLFAQWHQMACRVASVVDAMEEERSA